MFQLHDQLRKDTTIVSENDACVLLLANDARYPWLILVPKVAEIKEIYQLSEENQLMFSRTSIELGRELMNLFNGDKLNVAALGNQVPQLHVHHIVRYQNDAAWPSPIWGLGEAAVYTKTELDERLQQLRDGLSFCQ